MSCRAIQIAALLVPSSLWAAAPESVADKTIRISMVDAVVARADLHKPAKGPWYRLQDMEDFVLEFPQSNTYIDAAAYCPYKPAMVTVNYTRHTDNNAEATLQSKDFTVQIALNYTREDAGTATIAWHEAGDTRYFRNATFTIESDAKRHAGLVLPMEQIARDPEMWDDGLQGILTGIEKMVPGNAIERLYTKRLCTLLPLVMMTFDASHTTPEFKGNTALHYACGLSHVELIRWLVEHGADLQACTDNGTGIDACVSGKNAAAIKAILREARAWRDAPRHGVEIDAAAACEAASWLDEAFSGNELDSPDFIIPLKDEKGEECARLVYRYIKSGNSLSSLGMCTTDTPGQLLIRVMNAKVSEQMYVDWIQRELKNRRMKQQVVRRKDGLALAALPHMILQREEEGMPYDGKSPLYRAAEEGNVELVKWLLAHSIDRRITDAQGADCDLPANAPNAAVIRALIHRAGAAGEAPASVAGKMLTFTASSLTEPYTMTWKQSNAETEGEAAEDEDWCIIELRYTRTGKETATVIRKSQWAPRGRYDSGRSEDVFTLHFTTPDSGTATYSDRSKDGSAVTHYGTFTLK